MDTNYQNQPTHGQRQESLPNATTILVLGILSIVLCQPLGIAALIMGNNSLRTYSQNPERYSEGSLSSVKAGRICGIIGICLMVLAAILLIAGVSFIPFMDRHDDY
jgi:hypothetical protein